MGDAPKCQSTQEAIMGTPTYQADKMTGHFSEHYLPQPMRELFLLYHFTNEGIEAGEVKGLAQDHTLTNGSQAQNSEVSLTQ